jgi:phi13 family phage major tail protein
MAHTYQDYRGVEGLVYAEVIQDTSAGYITGTVKPLAGVAEISKTTETSSDTKFYDNIPAIVIDAQGADTLTITTDVIPYEVLADINGQYYDENTGMFVEQESVSKYFAIGYVTETTSGQKILVWRLKGKFNIPDSDHVTRDAGTDSNGQELTYTGINTTYKIVKTTRTAKSVNVPVSDKVDTSDFFDSVQTPDTVGGTPTPSVSVVPSRASVGEGKTIQLNSYVVPSGTAVTWSTTDTTYLSVNASTGVVTGVAAGSGTVTATITVGGSTYTDTCAVTVVASA